MKDLIRILYATLSVSILLATHYPLSMAAQDKGMTERVGQQKEMKENEVTVGLRAGHNAAFGGFAAMSVETYQTIRGGLAISGGVQYNTIGKTTLEARPAYTIGFDWGRLTPELLLTYTDLASTGSFAAGAGLGADFGRVSAKLGYYYHTFGGHGGWITEPFNIYYELNVHLLKKVEDWKVDLTITNNEMFELERHYQPSFIAWCCHYPTDRLGISFGIGCKPAGMFHMSADYYQTYIKTGVCYRW
jgi:hypothetical protein